MAPIKAGEFILGYPERQAGHPNIPQPEILTRERQLRSLSTLARTCRSVSPIPSAERNDTEEQELIAAKLMGRWRSGAPLVLSPENDDPELGGDLKRTNNFNYKEKDPHGYAAPLAVIYVV